MSLLFIFPGQGTQHPGMLAKLPSHPAVSQTLSQASDILGYHVHNLDEAKAQRYNHNVQLAICICSLACANMLKYEGIKADHVMGLSVGAFPAAIHGGILSVEDGLKAVEYRGQLMSQAYPVGYGMAAVLGLSTPEIKQIVSQVQLRGGKAYLANINSPDQHILAGSEEGLTLSCSLAKQRGARDAQTIRVDVPSHCELMDEQAEQLHQNLQQLSLKPPIISYTSSNAARMLMDPNKICEDLALNMARTVQWQDAIHMLYQRGVDLVIEMEPGNVLTALSQDKSSEVETLSMANTSIETLAILAKRDLFNA